MVTWLGLTGCERDCRMGNSSIACGTYAHIFTINRLLNIDILCSTEYCTIKLKLSHTEIEYPNMLSKILQIAYPVPNVSVYRLKYYMPKLNVVKMSYAISNQGRIQDLIRGGAQIVTGLKLPFWGLSFVEFMCWGLIFGGQGGGAGAPPGSAPANIAL